MPIDPVTGSLITGAMQVGGQLLGQGRQARHNRKLAEFQHQKNMELLKYQLDYNSPKEQMKRFGEAGLNPHLIYGQASSGNWSQSQQYPNIQPTDMSINVPNVLQMATQAEQLELLKTQSDLNRVKAGEGTAKTELIQAQKDLVKANPYLNEGYLKSLVSQMESKAKILQKDAFVAGTLIEYTDKQGNQALAIPAIIQAEQAAQNLSNSYKLNEADNKIKAEILQSKSFQNDLDKVWNDFLKQPNLDGDTISRMLIMLITKLFK